MADAYCVLCSVDVSSGTDRAKRLKLYGKSCSEVREKLELILNQELGVSLRYTGVDEESYVCYKCRAEVDRYFKMIRDLNSFREDITSKYRTNLLDENSSQVRSTRKRKQPTTQPSTSGSSCQSSLASTPKRHRAATSSTSSKVKITIEYPSGPKHFNSCSPWTSENIKRLCRGSYPSLASSIATSHRAGNAAVAAVARVIRGEIKNVCSVQHNSILRDDVEGVKHFQWATVWSELANSVPAFMELLCGLVHNPSDNKPLISLIASMIIKQWNPKVSLCQRAISALLYSCAVPKKVYKYFRSLMICHSYKQTTRIMKKLLEDYDQDVLEWGTQFVDHLQARKYLTTNDVSSFSARIDAVTNHEEDKELPPTSTGDDVGQDVTTSRADDEDEDDSDIGSDDDDHDDTNDETVDQSMENQHADRMDQTSEAAFGTDSYDIWMRDLGLSNDGQQSLDVSRAHSWNGFKLVMDNLDKNARRSYQRSDRTTRSIHCVHSYGVLDRVNLSDVSDAPSEKEICFNTLLPSVEDITCLKKTFVILISRILVEILPVMKSQSEDVIWHISHQFQKEMSRKSEVVPLGVIMHNENRLDEMCLILDELSKYCPMYLDQQNSRKTRLHDGRYISERSVKVYEIGIGGDQLTCARVRGAQGMRRTHNGSDHKLKSYVPLVEDWHCRMTLLTVIWSRMFNKTTVADRGTLYQLKSLLNMSSVPSDPKSNVKSCEDFLLTVLYGLVKSAAVEVTKSKRIEKVDEVAEEIVKRFVNIDVPVKEDDSIHFYTTELLTLSLTWHNYHDSIREGDGDRIMLLWKFLMIIFKKAHRTNYSIEAFNVLMQYHFLLSDRLAQQLKWSRFINTHGRQGCNIPCDLHLEHLNRRLKGILRHLSSNLQSSTIKRVSRSISVAYSLQAEFEKESGQQKEAAESGNHNKPSHINDSNKLASVFEESGCFVYHKDRKFGSSFKNQKPLLDDVMDKDESIMNWMLDKVANIIF